MEFHSSSHRNTTCVTLIRINKSSSVMTTILLGTPLHSLSQVLRVLLMARNVGVVRVTAVV
jgi:hypothetical protein